MEWAKLACQWRLKDAIEHEDKKDTLYFNAFTEDLFDWDNDLDEDRERKSNLKHILNSLMALMELVLKI